MPWAMLLAFPRWRAARFGDREHRRRTDADPRRLRRGPVGTLRRHTGAAAFLGRRPVAIAAGQCGPGRPALVHDAEMSPR